MPIHAGETMWKTKGECNLKNTCNGTHQISTLLFQYFKIWAQKYHKYRLNFTWFFWVPFENVTHKLDLTSCQPLTYMLIFRDWPSLFPLVFWSAELNKLREELEGKAAFPLLPVEWVRNESSEIKSCSLDKEFWLKKIHKE